MAITPSYAPMTELEAVNSMLLSIGKSPVNTLAVAGINDVSWAQTTLYNVDREVQSRGWWFNVDTQFPVTPDINGNIVVPANALDMRPSERYESFVYRYNPAVTGPCLWDLDNLTFNIGANLNGKPLLCEMVWYWPFEQIPQQARQYVAMRAGRVFQASAVGSQVLYQFTKEMELEAEAECKRRESRNGKSNMFSTPTRINRIVNRQPGAYRGSW